MKMGYLILNYLFQKYPVAEKMQPVVLPFQHSCDLWIRKVKGITADDLTSKNLNKRKEKKKQTLTGLSWEMH